MALTVVALLVFMPFSILAQEPHALNTTQNVLEHGRLFTNAHVIIAMCVSVLTSVGLIIIRSWRKRYVPPVFQGELKDVPVSRNARAYKDYIDYRRFFNDYENWEIGAALSLKSGSF